MKTPTCFDAWFILAVHELYPDAALRFTIVRSTSDKEEKPCGYQFTRGGIMFSVQFGPSNYCETRYMPHVDRFDFDDGLDYTQSRSAEIAAWYIGNNRDIDLNPDSSESLVKGYVDPENVLLTMIDVFGN